MVNTKGKRLDSLLVAKIEDNAEGQFTCEGSDTHGFNEASVQVRVRLGQIFVNGVFVLSDFLAKLPLHVLVVSNQGDEPSNYMGDDVEVEHEQLIQRLKKL